MARDYACAACEVAWHGMDPCCWVCGDDTEAHGLIDHTVPVGGARMVPPTTGVQLTRWGTNFLRAQELGLPDPRQPGEPGRTAA